MAVSEVFSAAELERLRRFPEPTRLELVRYFTLTGDQVEFLAGRRGDRNRLGLAVQMATLPWLGFVPDDVEAAPVEAVARLAGSLGIDPGVLAGYGRRDQTRTEQLRVTIDRLGWRTATRSDWKMLSEFLSARALERDSSKVLFAAACEFLRAEQVVRPGVVSLLERVGAARDRAHEETWVRLAPLVTAAWRTVLDGMLVVDAALGGTRLEWLCRGPTVASARTIHGEIAKLSYLRSIGADSVEMSVLPLERLRFLAGVGRRASPAGLRRREPTRRYPIVFATATQAAVEVLDELVELFD